jgi:hypothetical protein
MPDAPPNHEQVIEGALRFYRETLEWLIAHHARFAAKTSHDLAANDRVNAIWKLSGESLAHAIALVDLLERGYTAQTWPAMRAIHEADRLLAAVSDHDEERIPRRWLSDQQIKQAEAREAEQRGAERLAAQLRAVGEEPLVEDVKHLSQQIYKGMSRAAHHQRSVVDESVDHTARTFIYGPDPRVEQRLDYTVYAGVLLQEVLLLTGDALSFLWGPTFYPEHLAAVLRSFDTMLASLDSYEFVRRAGWLIDM